MPALKSTPDTSQHLRRATARNYDRLSRFYDALSGRAERGCTEACIEMLGLQPGQQVLEIGPGTGHGLVALASACGRTGHVYGLDLSAGMLSVARRRLRRSSVGERTSLVRGDGVHLPFASRSLNAVLTAFTLELFSSDDLLAVLHECARVLAPHGRLGIVAMAMPARANAMSRLYAWAHRRWPGTIDCRPIDVASELARAGFEIEGMQRTAIWGLPVGMAVAKTMEPA